MPHRPKLGAGLDGSQHYEPIVVETFELHQIADPGAGLTGRTRWSTTEDDLLLFCRGHLAPYQVPASITFVDRLPRNAVGKLVRDELSKLAAGGRSGAS